MANLSQLKILEQADGFLCVDKPAGMPFPTVVKTVKRKFNLVKAGHCGALDALASGLAVLAVNDATRYAADVMGSDRSWEGVMRLGESTDTCDVNGRPDGRHRGSGIPGDAAVLAARRELTGDVFQTESRFSAIRKEVSAGYEIVETGEHKPFLAHVYRFETSAPETGSDGAVRIKFTLDATKSLIPRSLVDDFGAALGCGAALESLRRTRIGKFSLPDAIAFEKLVRLELHDLPGLLLPLSKVRS